MTDDHRPDPDRPLTLTDTPAAAPPDTPQLEPAPPRPRDHRLFIILGAVAVVLVLGVLVALSRPAPDEERAEASAAGMSLEMVEPPPPPTPRPGAPLEVLAPDMAAAADLSGEMARELIRPGQQVVPEAPAQSQDEAEAEAPPEASFDCNDARSPAEEMVCRDSGLAAADRELARTYRRALEAGAPSRQLRAEQQDWYEIREDAARRSPAAVSRVYRQRIDELNRLADEFR